MSPTGRTRRPLRRLALAAAALMVVPLAAAGAPALAVPAQLEEPPPTQSSAEGWEMGDPPLTTPWTADVSPENALPEYPRPQLVREQWQNLNGVWEFAAADGTEPPVGQELAERVLVPYPIESALSGIQRYEPQMWYRRTFTVPEGWNVGSGQRLMLHFGAVDYDAKVWVNGELVTEHRGGYDSFSADVTDALDGTGPQELIVWAEDLADATWQPVGKQRLVGDRGIFYQGSSGIWQTVWMEPVAPAHIAELEMTPELSDSTLRLTAETSGGEGLTVEATAYDSETGEAVGTVTGPADTELAVPVPDAKLWSPDSPFLYDLTVRLLDGDEAVDTAESYFGMREIGTAKDADGTLRMTLNGEILFHMSTLDQGFWPDGLHTAPTDEALAFDLEQHKVLGFNTVRKHIKVEPDRWFYHADRLGLLVWQDMPSSKLPRIPEGPWRDQFEAELHEMVEEHDSWTSVVLWVVFNEGWGEWDLDATARIVREVQEQDPSRLVNGHSGVNCCLSLGDTGTGDMIDHHAYPGPATPVPTDDRVAADGEHGGFGLEVPGHMWFGEGHAYAMLPTKEALTEAYVENQRQLANLARSCLSAGVYTQITDVEHEVNGFFTYDRQVEKMNFDAVREVNEQVIAAGDGTGSGEEPQDPGTPGLAGVAAYPFDEGEGTTAEDVVGDNEAMLVNDPTWVEGVEGSALQFNGSNQFVDTGAGILDTTGSYSVSAWAKLDTAGGAFQTVVSQDADPHSAFFLQYSGADERWAFSFVGGRALSPEKPEVDRWYHLVGVRDDATGENRLYVDGELAGTYKACAGTPSTGNTVIGRGKFNGGPVDFLDGSVDQVRLFDRALSADEVAQLSGNEPGDTEAPTVTISGVEDGASYDVSEELTVSWEVSEEADVTATLDGEALENGATLSGLAAGEHTIEVTATDASGNAGSASVTFTVTEEPGEEPGNVEEQVQAYLDTLEDYVAEGRLDRRVLWQIQAGADRVLGYYEAGNIAKVEYELRKQMRTLEQNRHLVPDDEVWDYLVDEGTAILQAMIDEGEED